MTVKTFDDGGYIVTDHSIPLYRLLMLRQGLKMEMKGLRISSRGPTAYTIIKKEFDLKGSKAKVLAAFECILTQDYNLNLTNLSV